MTLSFFTVLSSQVNSGEVFVFSGSVVVLCVLAVMGGGVEVVVTLSFFTVLSSQFNSDEVFMFFGSLMVLYFLVCDSGQGKGRGVL